MSARKKLQELANQRHHAHRDQQERNIQQKLLEEEARLVSMGYVRFPRQEPVFATWSWPMLKDLAKEARLDFVDLGGGGSIRVWAKPDDIDALRTLIRCAEQDILTMQRIDENTRQSWRMLAGRPAALPQLVEINELRAQYNLPALKVLDEEGDSGES